MSFKKRIENFLLLKNINKRELAELINKNPQQINRWTNAEKPSIDFLLALNEVYPDVDFNYLIKEKREIIYEIEPSVLLAEESANPFLAKTDEQILDSIHLSVSELKRRTEERHKNATNKK